MLGHFSSLSANTKMFEIVESEGLLNERYDHFNQNAVWKAGQIESRNYTSNDLTILKAMEWDRINFSDPEKRKKICEWLRVTEAELLERRRETINNIYNTGKHYLYLRLNAAIQAL